MTHDSHHYNRLTVDEVAAIIIQPENDNESLNRDIIIQHWNINELWWISQHFFFYISMRYSLIFPHDKKKWYSFISLIDINLIDNINLYAHHRTCINSEFENDNNNDMQDAIRHEWEGSKRMSQSQYYIFQLQNHDDIFSSFLHVNRLYQEYYIDA